MNKSTLDLSVIHDRNPVFVLLSDGSIRNGYELKIINKTHENKKFKLTLTNPQSATLRAQNFDLSNLEISAENEKNFRIFITASSDILEKSDDSRFVVELEIEDLKTGEKDRIESIFIGK